MRIWIVEVTAESIIIPLTALVFLPWLRKHAQRR